MIVDWLRKGIRSHYRTTPRLVLAKLEKDSVLVTTLNWTLTAEVKKLYWPPPALFQVPALTGSCPLGLQVRFRASQTKPRTGRRKGCPLRDVGRPLPRSRPRTLLSSLGVFRSRGWTRLASWVDVGSDAGSPHQRQQLGKNFFVAHSFQRVANAVLLHCSM